MRRLEESGYTALELLAVGLLLVAIIIPSLFLTHPKNYNVQIRNAEREIAIAELMQGIHAYVAHNGSLPSNLPSTMEPIGSADNQVNLCSELVPMYLHTLPVDPFLGSVVHCSSKGQYQTGIGIQKTGKGNQVTIASLGSEGRIIYLTD